MYALSGARSRPRAHLRVPPGWRRQYATRRMRVLAPAGIMRRMENGESAGGRLVLVVDDDADFCLMISQLLRLCGFRVAIASNGIEALEVLARRPVSVVLTDLFMPR